MTRIKVRYQIFEVRLSACTCYYKADTKVERYLLTYLLTYATRVSPFALRAAYLRQQGAEVAKRRARQRAAAADTTHHAAWT